MVKASTVRKPSAYKSIRTDVAHPYQEQVAQRAAAKAKASSPADIERSLQAHIPQPAPLPKTGAEMDAVLARCAPPIRAVPSPANNQTPLVNWESVAVWGLSWPVCIAFWIIIMRELWGLIPTLWSLISEMFDRSLPVWQGWLS